MEEKMDKVYQQYLEKRLDKVFEDAGEDLSSDQHVVNVDEFYYQKMINDLAFKHYYEYIDGKKRYNFYDANGNPLCDEWYDSAEDFKEGFALVEKDEKYNYINESGKPICDEWYDDVQWNFDTEFAWVEKDGKYNYIDKTGKPICEKWLDVDKVEKFENGFGKIKKNNKFNFVNSSGKIISEDEWFDEVYSFSEGFAVVKKNGKYNFIDANGTKLFDKWLTYADSFSCGYAVIKKDGLVYHIDTKGNPISDERFDSIYSFRDGFARVRRNNKYNFIDLTGKPISEEWFDKVWDFRNGYARVEKNNKTNFIDTNGNPISKEWFDDALHDDRDVHLYFYNNRAVVEKNREKFYINTKGQRISSTWTYSTARYEYGFAIVDEYFLDSAGRRDAIVFLSGDKMGWSDFISVFRAGDFIVLEMDGEYNFLDSEEKLVHKEWIDDYSDYSDGLSRVKRNGRINYMDLNKQFIFNKWFDYFKDFKYGYGVAGIDGKYNVVDRKGNYLLKNPIRDMRKPDNIDCYLYPSFISFHGVICLGKDLGDYQVSRGVLGFKCKSTYDEFHTKFEPVKIYDKRYALYVNNKRNVCLFDRTTKSDKELGSIEEIEFKDNFIFDHSNKKVYFVYDGLFNDITPYYNKKLYNKSSIVINDKIPIIDREIFSTNEDIKSLIKQELDEDKKREEARKREEERRKVQEVAAKNEKVKEIEKLNQMEALYQLKKSLSKYVELSRKMGVHERIAFTDIFNSVSNHLEIDPTIIEMNLLHLLNLGVVSFKNVKMSGINFSGCNISFNPQEVFNKDLSNSNFEGISFPVSTNFTGVNICGAKFTNDGRATTFDINEESLSKGIYDENTTLNGVPLTELIEKIEPTQKSA